MWLHIRYVSEGIGRIANAHYVVKRKQWTIFFSSNIKEQGHIGRRGLMTWRYFKEEAYSTNAIIIYKGGVNGVDKRE